MRAFTASEDGASQRLTQIGALVTGPAGMGQSQFFREVKVRAQTLGRRCYLEVGYPGRAESPGSLLRCLVGEIAGADRAISERWQAFLGNLARPRSSSWFILSSAR